MDLVSGVCRFVLTLIAYVLLAFLLQYVFLWLLKISISVFIFFIILVIIHFAYYRRFPWWTP
jgi:hypothetical protein